MLTMRLEKNDLGVFVVAVGFCWDCKSLQLKESLSAGRYPLLCCYRLATCQNCSKHWAGPGVDGLFKGLKLEFPDA